MLLTRRACYGLLAVQHLAEHVGEGSFAANGLAEFHGLPREALAKILQRLAAAGVLLSHHGIKGGYTLARDPRYISVFDAIKASEEPRRSGIHGEQRRHPDSVPGYHARCKVSQIVEDMLRELTIEDIEEKASSPDCLSRDASSVRAS
jgi:Rrf2 family protein